MSGWTGDKIMNRLMKTKTVLFFLVILAYQTLWSQTDADRSRVLSVLSFNILHGATMKGDFDLDVIAKVIKDVNPDFVALQEVDFKTNRARQFDLVTELGWRTKLIPLFGKAMEYDGGEYGEGVLSRYSFLSSRNVALPHSRGNEPRAALEIITAIRSKDTIAFVGTHLDHLSNEKDRVAQVKKINEVFSLNRYPTILAGDLNDIPGTKPIDILEEIWLPAYDKDNPEPTYPSGVPVKKIDYIMFYPKNRWKVLETRVINDSIASDHCAYWVRVELLPE